MANTRFKTHHGILATSNSRVEGDLTVTGNLQVSGTFNTASQIVGDFFPELDQSALGSATKRWNLSAFTANVASTLTANGATTLSNTLTTTGAGAFQNTITVTGNATFQNTLSVAGQTNVAANLNVTGSETVGGLLTVTGNTSVTGGILTVSTNATNSNTVTIGAANTSVDSGVLFVDAVNNRVGINNTAPGVALRVTGDTDTSGSANVQANLSVGNALTVTGNATVNNVTLNGNLTLGSATVINSNVNFDSGVLFVDAVNNRVGINNTAPGVALRVTGAVDVSTTANVQGALAVGGNASVGGQLTISNSSTTHNISGNVAFDTTTLVIDSINNRVGLGIAAPTTPLDVAGDIKGSANITGTIINGTNFVSNSTGVYHTGTVNAASFTTTRVTSNSSGLYPSSNGTPLGNTTARWDIFASSINLGGSVASGNSTANVITGNNYISANSIALTLTGTVTVTAGSTAIVGSGTSFLTQVVVGDVLRFSSCNDIYYTVTARTTDTALTVLPMPDANVAGAGLTVEKKRIATVNTNGVFLIGNNQLILPSSTEANSSVGNMTARWNVYGIVGDFSSTVTAAGGINATGTTSTTTDFRVGTIGTSNGFIANSTAIAIGNSSVNTTITPTSFSTSQLSASQGFTSGTIGATSGFVANSTQIVVGNNSVNTRITSAGIDVAGGYVNASAGIYSGTIGTSNGTVITSGIITIGNTSVNAQITPVRWNINGVAANGSGLFLTGTGQNLSPATNAAATTLGTNEARWSLVYAQEGNFSGALSAVDITSQGTVNVATQVRVGTVGLISGFLANTTTIVVGNSSVQTDLTQFDVSTANVIFTDRLTSGTIGTTTSGLVASNSAINLGNNASNVQITPSGITINGGGFITSATGGLYAGSIGVTNGAAVTQTLITIGNNTVNSQLTSTTLTTGTINTGNVLATGTVNSSIVRTSVVIANTSGLYPSSNGTPLGSTTSRWEVLGANGSFSGTVTAGTLSATSLSVTNFTPSSLIASSNNAALGNNTGRWAITATSANFSEAVAVTNSFSFSGTLRANNATGSAGQVLTSGGTGNAYWSTISVPTSNTIIVSNTTGSNYLGTWGQPSGNTNTSFIYTNITASNSGRVSAVEFYATSDIRQKENIQQIEGAVDIVNRMRGVSFNLKENGIKSYGVIAQEMETVLPDIVGENDLTGTKYVNYDAIVGVLIEAIKELKQEINELKNGNQS